eukprot:TRINITY_DN61804_c0_g1_i1.p1 TRINITY_DN61804_c0_g1~~TRINITY_DN61804_c0_g1_i1.p1  ORF type:complete len:618 (+),score=28.96 TRINITY_DN61804_c0_g1_i1:26-1855(+)
MVACFWIFLAFLLVTRAQEDHDHHDETVAVVQGANFPPLLQMPTGYHFLDTTHQAQEPPNLSVSKIQIQSSLLELQSVADDQQEFEAQVIVQARWRDDRIINANHLTAATLPWQPIVFAMNAFDLVGDPIVVFDTKTGFIETTRVYHSLSKFSFDPLAYPFDSHELHLNVYFGVPASRAAAPSEGGGHSHEEGHEEGAGGDEMEHSTEQAWSITSITQRSFVFCFPFHGADKATYAVSKVFLDETTAPGQSPIDKLLDGDESNSTCLMEPMVGQEIIISISRKSSGFVVRLLLPIGCITLLSTAQVWMDLKFIGSRNQIVTLSMLTSFNMIGGTRLPHTNSVSWFELFGFVGVTVFVGIVCINILSHNLERKGRPQFSRLFDKAARAVLPLHFFSGVVTISLISFVKPTGWWVLLYVALMSIFLGAAIKWGRSAAEHDKIQAERIQAIQARNNRKEEEKMLIGRAHLQDMQNINKGESKENRRSSTGDATQPAPPIQENIAARNTASAKLGNMVGLVNRLKNAAKKNQKADTIEAASKSQQSSPQSVDRSVLGVGNDDAGVVFVMDGEALDISDDDESFAATATGMGPQSPRSASPQHYAPPGPSHGYR